MGSTFIRYLLKRYDYSVTNLDKLTYAGNLDNLRDVEDNERYTFIRGDICDAGLVEETLRGAWAVVNIAAETHVDRSMMDAGVFIDTDVRGTFILMEAARKVGVMRSSSRPMRFTVRGSQIIQLERMMCSCPPTPTQRARRQASSR